MNALTNELMTKVRDSTDFECSSCLSNCQDAHCDLGTFEHILIMSFIGGEIRGAEGVKPLPPTLIGGGLSPLIFQMCIQFSMLYTIKGSLKTTVRTQKTSETLRVENSKFPGGACPQTPLDGYWLLSLKPRPPHFCRTFSALVLTPISMLE